MLSARISKVLIVGCVMQSSIALAQQTVDAEPSKTWSDGTRYFGDYRNEMREGEGQIVWPNGTQYIGTFKNDLREGQGRLILPDGSSYIAMYKSDVIVSDSIAQEANSVSMPDSDQFLEEMNRQIIFEVGHKVMQWQEAWASQNLTNYFEHYSSRFSPLAGASLSSWKQLRAVRINRPKSINIDIVDSEYDVQSDDTVTVRFEQRYTSNLYSDKAYKELTFQRELGGWKIVHEKASNR